MKELKLQNSTRPATVDDEDLERLSLFKWHVTKSQSNISRNKKSNYRNIHTSLAAEIMRQPKQMFDHIDRDPFNNQKSNLRACTKTQNQGNKSKQKGCSSVYRGVSWFKPSGKWQAQIRIDYTLKTIGLFSNEVDAARAYNKEALAYFGEFANLNILP